MSWAVDHGSPGPGPEIPENTDDILVFGYGCKLFRDDEKAEWIDKECHLIPWMGDTTLTIDRYDGRGALMDLRSFAPPPEGFEDQPFTPEEIDLEKLLQEERYKDLREDSEYDDLDYQEVEFRKFQSDVNGVVGQGQYAAIGYSYDEAAGNVESVYPVPKKIDEDLPYVKPVGLIIPEDITLPTTIKLHAIIEKTAKFIASHGNQMEIILKTKQSGNLLFNFLGYTDSLNPYYKFLVQAIRSNNYKPAEETPEEDLESTSHEDCSGSEDESSYLHPSLFRSSAVEPFPSISKITYKHPSGPTAYSMLVSKIKGSNPEPVPAAVTADSYNCYYTQGQESSGTYSHGWSDPTGTTSEQSTQLDPSVTPGRPQSQVPAQQDQLVIEKMASYVVKNGFAFEELARTKGDPRFLFLHPSHEYHWYYLNCKERFKAETSAVVASGNFVSYSDSSSSNNTNSISAVSSTTSQLAKTIKTLEIRRITPLQKEAINLQSISLPLSASGIPIANHASISSRPTSIPPEVASRIEEIKKKINSFAKKEPPPSVELSPQKKDKVKIQFSSSICRNMSLGTETISASGEEKSSSDEVVIPNECDMDCTIILSSQKVDPLRACAGDTPAVDVLVSLGNGSQTKDVVVEEDKEDEDEKERKRKEDRRRKAALFLQRIKLRSQKPTTIPKCPTEALSSNNNELDKNGLIDEALSDVESIPDPGGQMLQEELKENDIRASDKARERLWDESKIQIGETERLRKNGSSSRSSSLRPTRSRSRSRSRLASYRTRSLSTSSDSSLDSSKSRRKRSKRKHSKKRKKKHEKERSSSRSRTKKSKRHKH